MRKSSVKIFLILICIVLIAAFAGCASPVLTRPARSPGAATYNITGSCDISVQNSVITVTGETNIMDGAKLQIAVVGQDGLTLDSVVISKSEGQISQSFNITDKYKNIRSITGFITCAPRLYGAHPESVYNSYGQKFENIVADNSNYLWDSGGNIIIFQSEESVELPGQ